MNSHHCDGLIECWYLYYYFKYRTHNDYLSFKLMDYKGDKEAQIEIFSRLAADAFAKDGLKFDHVVRVLGSEETTPKATSRIIPVAKAIVTATGASYIPQLLYKTRKTKPLKNMTQAQREAELEGVYVANEGYNLDGKKVLIVDDIATTGTTMSFVAKAILEQYPEAQLYGFSLAHTQNFGSVALNKNASAWEEEYKAAIK